MPVTTPLQKIGQVRFFGGKFVTIKLVGDTFDASAQAAQEYTKSEGMTFIDPFDDYNVQAGDVYKRQAMGFVDSVKEDIFSERIYVFTPNGAVQELPKDSGPIDFAYAIHTQVGEKATGAKVNGRMVQMCIRDSKISNYRYYA